VPGCTLAKRMTKPARLRIRHAHELHPGIVRHPAPARHGYPITAATPIFLAATAPEIDWRPGTERASGSTAIATRAGARALSWR